MCISCFALDTVFIMQKVIRNYDTYMYIIQKVVFFSSFPWLHWKFAAIIIFRINFILQLTKYTIYYNVSKIKVELQNADLKKNYVQTMCIAISIRWGFFSKTTAVINSRHGMAEPTNECVCVCMRERERKARDTAISLSHYKLSQYITGPSSAPQNLPFRCFSNP